MEGDFSPMMASQVEMFQNNNGNIFVRMTVPRILQEENFSTNLLSKLRQVSTVERTSTHFASPSKTDPDTFLTFLRLFLISQVDEMKFNDV